MSRRARWSAVLAVALAACSPAVERRAGNPFDSATTVAAATTEAAADSAVPAGPVAAARETAAVDSLRGVVERVGSDPTSRLVVRGADGLVCALQLTTPQPFEGLEVTLWGRREAASATMLPGVTCLFTVGRYAVRAVDGITAVDGTLRLADGAYLIEVADGLRRPLRDVPPALRTRIGARIYWAGPLDRAPAAYGVLTAVP